MNAGEGVPNAGEHTKEAAQQRRQRGEQFQRLAAAIAGTLISLIGSGIPFGGAFDTRTLAIIGAAVSAVLAGLSGVIVLERKRDRLDQIKTTLKKSYAHALQLHFAPRIERGDQPS